LTAAGGWARSRSVEVGVRLTIGRLRSRMALPFAAASMLLAIVSRATAHPHVLVDVQVELLFDAPGRLTHVRNIWQFDPAFSLFATLGLARDNDGALSEEVLARLAKGYVDALKDYGFFNALTVGKQRATLAFPDNYSLRVQNRQLTLVFDLPVNRPTRAGDITLKVYDPEYFVAFGFAKKDPVTLQQPPPGCTTQLEPPQPLDAGIMGVLAAVPADQRNLPPDLKDAASALANIITVTCPR
jgi:ABC-type uncharacterized transport system substrate-binding protein